MRFGDQQAMLAEGSSMRYSVREIETPCLRELVLHFNTSHCSWFLLSYGIISERDSSTGHWVRPHLFCSLSLWPGMLFSEAETLTKGCWFKKIEGGLARSFLFLTGLLYLLIWSASECRKKAMDGIP